MAVLVLNSVAEQSSSHTHYKMFACFFLSLSIHYSPVIPESTAIKEMSETKQALPDAAKLIIGAGGIYGAFLYYGSLQEDVFRFTAEDGSTFKQAWFLQVLEALANVVIGFIGMLIQGPTKVPLKMFAISGAAQVSAKACTSLAPVSYTHLTLPTTILV